MLRVMVIIRIFRITGIVRRGGHNTKRFAIFTKDAICAVSYYGGVTKGGKVAKRNKNNGNHVPFYEQLGVSNAKELHKEAKKLGIKGQSSMGKEQLMKAIHRRQQM